MTNPEFENRDAFLAAIRSVYPELGRLGIELNADYDGEQRIWVVVLRKGDRTVRAYLERADADSCMAGQRCVALGIEMAQLQAELENP